MSAKWHREQAKKELKEAAWRQSYADRDPPGYGEHDSHAFHAEKHRATSAHHEVAADVLDALAVEGVARLLEGLAYNVVPANSPQEKALRTLADAARRQS